MFENYIEDFDREKAISMIMEQTGAKSPTAALAAAGKKIPKESYYQDKIRRRLKQAFPEAFCRKISQGVYAEAGIPDLMFIQDGHYFGFEVKRPLVGKLSDIQRRTIWLIRQAGGTAAVVSWPEEALRIVNDWEREEAFRFFGQAQQDEAVRHLKQEGRIQ